jgi:hypothetical protein
MVGISDQSWLSLCISLGCLLACFQNHSLSSLRCSGVASAYGWVTILLYCLWLNKHIHYFLTYGDLEEEIYMKQLEVFVVKGKKDLVCKLKRSLYGLKQSPRMWYQKFDTYILSMGFVRSKANHYIYSKEEGGRFIYVALYVDDMLLIGNNMDTIKEVKKQLSSKFDMKDIDATNFIMKMRIKRDRATRQVWFNQMKYIETILKCFNMQDFKSVKVQIPVGARLTVEQCPKT